MPHGFCENNTAHDTRFNAPSFDYLCEAIFLAYELTWIIETPGELLARKTALPYTTDLTQAVPLSLTKLIVAKKIQDHYGYEIEIKLEISLQSKLNNVYILIDAATVG